MELRGVRKLVRVYRIFLGAPIKYSAGASLIDSARYIAPCSRALRDAIDFARPPKFGVDIVARSAIPCYITGNPAYYHFGDISRRCSISSFLLFHIAYNGGPFPKWAK